MDYISSLKKENFPSLKGKLYFNYSLKNHTSLKIGGNAWVFFLPEDEEDLQNILSFSFRKKVPLTLIGNGTNLLIREGGIPGVVVKLSSKFAKIKEKEGKTKVGAALSLSRLVNYTVKRGLSGIEKLIGIPGSVGGAVVRNAGCLGEEISSWIKRMKIWDEEGKERIIPASRAKFSYRESEFLRKKWVITEVEFIFPRGEREKLLTSLKKAKLTRWLTQPLNKPSAGCIFKNPPGFSAGWLIEKAGCKGMREGQAQVSSKHANFIVNLGGAKSKEVEDLMERIRERVRRKFKIELKPEIDILGERRG